MTAFAPICSACRTIRSNASWRACSHISVHSVMLPPKRLWIPAPIVPTIDRERTTMPRTMPRLRRTRKPGRSWAEVVNARSSTFEPPGGLARLFRNELGLEANQRILLAGHALPHAREDAGAIGARHAQDDEESHSRPDGKGDQTEGGECEGEVAGPEPLAAQVIPDEGIGDGEQERDGGQREIEGLVTLGEDADAGARRQHRLDRQQVEDQAGHLDERASPSLDPRLPRSLHHHLVPPSRLKKRIGKKEAGASTAPAGFTNIELGSPMSSAL